LTNKISFSNAFPDQQIILGNCSKKKTLGNCSKNYFTIAIIGGQSTDKSTLLNHLFKTNFKVLEDGEDDKLGES
jgi:hypothetical protein